MSAEQLSPEAKRQLLKRLLTERKPGPAVMPASVLGAAPAADVAKWRTFDEHPGYRELRQRQDHLQNLGIDNPYFASSDGVAGATIIIEGREYINFSSYNYLDLAGDPRVFDAAKLAIDRFGTSASASRIAAGERSVHRNLEQAIAKMLGVDAAITFVGGHATNVSAIGHLFGAGDLILYDGLIHNSIMIGSILSGARQVVFPHNDIDALDRLLTKIRGDHHRAVVVVEGVYSMDGDIAPLDRLLEIKARHDVMLFVDEAHSLGVVGESGRGLASHFGIDPKNVDFWMGTLSKTLASCGGYIAGSAALVEYLRYTTPGFVYTCGMPPSVAAAALAALEIMLDEPERVERVGARGRLFLELARAGGLDTGSSQGSAVIPIIVGDWTRCMRVGQALRKDHSINVLPVIPPAVDDAGSRLRFFVSAGHTEEHIHRTVDALATEMAR